MERTETPEEFLERMREQSRKAREEYERMSPEDQKLLDEAARRHGDRVRSEIMASFPVGFEDKGG
jgi:hypothetical protein